MRAVLALVVLAACPKAAPVPDEPRMSSRVVPEREFSEMHVRLIHATQARDFVIKGQLDEARAQLDWVAGNVVPEGTAAQALHIEDLREAAQEGIAATDTGGLAEAVADVGRACGACHTTTGDGPTFQTVPVPDQSDAMARHVWAADRMWESLIAPDPERWRRAADVLEREVVDFEALYAGVDLETAGDAARLHARVHALGDMGDRPIEARDRAELYGAFVAACADCHAELERGPR